MPKTLVDEATYIAECNKALRRQEDFKEGMQVISVPVGAIGIDISGLDFVADELNTDVFVRACKEVEENFELRLAAHRFRR